MYIDTHSKITMQNSINDYLQISSQDLYRLFDHAGEVSQGEYYFNTDKFNSVIKNYVSSKVKNSKINEILFFHLSRRIDHNNACFCGDNLFDLLVKDSVMKDFLGNHDVVFKPCDGHLDLYYKGKIISLDDTRREQVSYLRWRLGYNKNRIDYCFNGFMLRDLLYKNNYARELYNCPEFLGMLAAFLKRKDIVPDYFKCSKYYCIEYCVPLEKVLFDNNDYLGSDEKAEYLVTQVIYRLYEYYVTESQYISDRNNPILRLADDDTMQQDYYINKEEIKSEMLR